MLETWNAGEFGMSPLSQKLMHDPALTSIQCTITRITTVPIGDSQSTTGFQHSQQFVGETLLVGHVRTRFNAPDAVKCSIRKRQVQCVHHFKTAGQICRREICGTFDLCGTDADTQHIKAIVPGQNSCAAADPAAHVEHL